MTNRHTKRIKNAAQRAADRKKRGPKQEMTLAERLYNAYGAEAQWKNYQGKPMPAWVALPPRIRACWNAVAKDAQAFAGEAMQHTIKGLVERNFGNGPKDAEQDADGEPEAEVKAVEIIKP